MAEWKESVGNFFKPEKVDDAVEGLLIKVEEKVGPNESMLYTLEEAGTREVVQVWGSTILDTKMTPVKIGEEVKIVYKGLAEKGGRGKNKPKLFQVFHREPEIDTFEAAEKEFEDVEVK